jgi:hypothetical protein
MDGTRDVNRPVSIARAGKRYNRFKSLRVPASTDRAGQAWEERAAVSVSLAMRTARAGALVLALLSSLIAMTAYAANTIVYRCLDAHLEVVYTDVPCKEGAPFEISAGDADPAALARLERIRDGLDQAAVQRLSDVRRSAGPTVMPVPMARESEVEEAGGYYTYPVAGYVSTRPQAAKASSHARSARHARIARGGAPSPPYIVPRSFR